MKQVSLLKAGLRSEAPSTRLFLVVVGFVGKKVYEENALQCSLLFMQGWYTCLLVVIKTLIFSNHVYVLKEILLPLLLL
jgi:hypothetical protein